MKYQVAIINCLEKECSVAQKCVHDIVTTIGFQITSIFVKTDDKIDSKRNDTELETQICSIYKKCKEL